jgi:hypothetical protein
MLYLYSKNCDWGDERVLHLKKVNTTILDFILLTFLFEHLLIWLTSYRLNFPQLIAVDDIRCLLDGARSRFAAAAP